MSPEEIEEAQTPYGGWERQTRAFSTNGSPPPPRWADFVDPLDAIGARFRPVEANRKDGRPLSAADRKSPRLPGLGTDDARTRRRRRPDNERTAVRKRRW